MADVDALRVVFQVLSSVNPPKDWFTWDHLQSNQGYISGRVSCKDTILDSVFSFLGSDQNMKRSVYLQFFDPRKYSISDRENLVEYMRQKQLENVGAFMKGSVSPEFNLPHNVRKAQLRKYSAATLGLYVLNGDPELNALMRAGLD